MRGYSAIGLDRAKSKENLGGVLRAAGCYGSAFVAISGGRMGNYATDTMKAYRQMPAFECVDLRNHIPYDCVPVAVEILSGARDLSRYTHPERAYYIFGPEDGSIAPSILKWCRDTIFVPTNGCMNLAATVNVVLYDRLSKWIRG